MSWLTWLGIWWAVAVVVCALHAWMRAKGWDIGERK